MATKYKEETKLDSNAPACFTLRPGSEMFGSSRRLAQLAPNFELWLRNLDDYEFEGMGKINY